MRCSGGHRLIVVVIVSSDTLSQMLKRPLCPRPPIRGKLHALQVSTSLISSGPKVGPPRSQDQ